ncbi:MAG TPA: hypothetical protein VGV67_12545 [Solirubrobacteraceae bacterium]|nr:hypothetical protein [Solirubrobacteraceae bacterium]
MNEQRLRDELRGEGSPDRAARERAWRTVRAAYVQREPQSPPHGPWRRVAAVTAVLLAVAVAVTTSAPGDAVARWVKRVLGAGQPDARPALVSVPGGGRLLVAARPGLWVVAPDGAKRLLGRYDDGAWSPRGLFVLAWRGRELNALEPGGRVRWSLSREGTIRSASWSPVDGFRVAYVSGSQLRIVNGDGTGDRRYGTASARVAPAWRPGSGHALAYADSGGRVRVAAVDARRQQWRSTPLRGLRRLAWSPGGERLLALTATRLVVFDDDGDVMQERGLGAAGRAQDAAWAPSGGRIALLRHDPRRERSDIVLMTSGGQRLLFSGPGRFGRLAWSPDGRRLLVPWPQADQWLFLRAGTAPRVTAVANIAAQFHPGASHPRFPANAGWCCPGKRGRP